MEPLEKRSCIPCRGGVPPLDQKAGARLLEQLEGWRIDSRGRLAKSWEFEDFRTALAFTNALGDLAEAEGHHPDIHLAWGRVAVEIWTHKINGLTESDFILAAKSDRVATSAAGLRP